MKRISHLVLLALMIVSTIATADGAAKTKSKKKQTAKEVTLDQTAKSGEAIPASVFDRARKQSDPDPVVVPKPGPIPFGPPVELQLKRADSVKFDLRTLPHVQQAEQDRAELPDPVFHPVTIQSTLVPPTINLPVVPAPSAPAPPPIAVYEGLDRFNWGAGSPPDTNGDVGPNNYIQTVNTSVGVYRKSDGFQQAAFTFNTFMSQGHFGNLCDTNNFGDPVVLYDTFEDRWIITDFAFLTDISGNVVAPSFQCFAASMTGDPVAGGWNFYSIQISDALNDYPKFGIWPDGLYMSANMFTFGASSSFKTARAWAFNKAQMYAGSPTVKVVTFDIGGGDFTIIPSNARLQTGTPPPGRPNLFISTELFLNALTVYKFHADWNNISLSTLTGPDTPLAATSWPNANVANAGQPGTTTILDVLQIRAMVQNQYTNLGGTESLWVPHTVRRGDTSGFAAPRWYQANVTGGTVAPNLVQATTWDPNGANVLNRFMPSLAVDRAGNMAIGYSTSSATVFPSMAYAGRLAADPVNTFSQTEQTFFTGTGSQTGVTNPPLTTRWGDYSAMTLDPNGCTFWYTNEYANPADQTFNHRWLTKFGSFGPFPGCTPVGAGGTISGTVTALSGGAPISGATVSLGARTTTTNASGGYNFSGIPAGTYPTITASYAGYNPSTVNSIVVTDGGTTTQNFSLTSASGGTCLIDTTQADFQAGVATNVEVTSSPGDVKLTSPNIIDQQSVTSIAGGFGLTSTIWNGQTFKAGVSGTLVAVDVNLFCLSCTGTTPNFTASIRATSAGLPTGADLVSTTVPGFNDGGAGSTHTADFSATPLALTAGTTYAFIIRPVANPSLGGYDFSVSNTPNPYAGGSRISSSNSGGTWAATTTRSAIFHTYVNNGFSPSGNLISSVKDGNPSVGNSPTWTTLSWTAMTPANTSVQFQAAGANSPNGPFNFVGPDGTAATFFTTTGASISQFNGLRYLEYKAILSSTNNTVTPTLNDVTACFADVACGASAPTITPTPASDCPLSAGNTASVPAGAINYSWAITNGTITSGGTSPAVTYTAGPFGSVGLQLTETDPTGCVVLSTTSVPIAPGPPTITPGGPTTFCIGGSVTLSSSALTGNQWYLNGNPIGGETNQTHIATASGNYTVTTTSGPCTSVPSAPVTVTVNPLPATPTISGTLSFCTGGNTTLTSSSATGNQWFVGNSPIAGETNQTYLATAAGSYTVQVTNGNGCVSAMSAAAVVSVISPPPVPAVAGTTNGTGTQDQACPEQPLTLTATSAGATSFQWYQDGVTMGGQTNSTVSVTSVGTYTATATVNGCPSAQSAGYVVQNPTPNNAFLTALGPTTFCAGGSVTLQSNSATGIQWYLDGNPLPNPNNQNRTVSVGGTYTVILDALGCHSGVSNSIVVTVNPLPATPTATPGGPTTFCVGGSVTLTSSAASGNQWLLNGNPIGGATNTTYGATASGSYTVTTTDGNSCTSAPSSAVVVTVNPLPATPTITPGGPTTFCTGGSVTLTSSAASGNQWLLNGNPIGGATNTTYVANASGNYTVTTTDGNSCTSAASAATAVTVNPIPATPTATPGGPTTFCAGGSVLLTSSSASGNQWFLNGNPIGGQTNQTYSATASGSYTVTVTTSGCTSAASAAVVVTVNPIPATPTITPGGPTTFCAGGSVTLTSSSASGNQWFLNGNPIGGQTNQTYSATASGSYTVTVTTTGCTSSASSATVVTVNPNPNATITAPVSVVKNSTGNIASVANAGAGATYAWSITGGTITAGTGTNSITFTAGAAPGTLTLNVTVTTSLSCSDTKSANVNVVLPTVTVTSVAPTFGTVTGGTSVTINGTNFVSGAGATFGGTAATNVVVVSAIKITAKTPAHASGAVNVTVTNTDTSTGTLTLGYQYNPQVFDPNGDGTTDPSDIFFLISYLYLGGPAPHGPGGVLSGDANGDGVVDPSDIFYLISYLYLGGQKPNAPSSALPSMPRASALGAEGPQLAGSITLGKAVLRAGRYVVPVIMTANPGSITPQSMSFRAHFETDGTLGDIAVHSAGAAKDAGVPLFEIGPRMENDLSYLVSYDPRKGGLNLGASHSAVVAEIEVATNNANIAISIDPTVTMLSDQSGTMTATVANGRLKVSGTTIRSDASPQPRAPRSEVN